MKKVTGQQAVKANADRKVVETVEELIAIFKKEFGNQWQNAFLQVFSISMRSDSV